MYEYISQVRTKQRASRVYVLDIRALVWKGFPEIAIIQNKNWKVSYLFYKRQNKEKRSSVTIRIYRPKIELLSPKSLNKLLFLFFGSKSWNHKAPSYSNCWIGDRESSDKLR